MIILFSQVSQVESPNIEGSWKGDIIIQGTQMPLTFHIKKINNTYTANLKSKIQEATDLLLDDVELHGIGISIGNTRLGINFSGNVEGETIKGTFSQGDEEFPLVLYKDEKLVPGDPTLPSTSEEIDKLTNYDSGIYKYQVEDYFAKPMASAFKFSPDGKYLSYREKDAHAKNHLYVKNLDTEETTMVVEEKEELIRGYAWANNNRLIYVMDQGGNENYHLYAADLNGSNKKELTPFAGVQVNILNQLKEDKDHIIISMNKSNAQVFEPYKININTGELEQLYKNEDVTNPIMGYIFDKDGKLRGFSRLRDGIYTDMFYAADGQNYELFKQISWKDTFVPRFTYNLDNPHEAYVTSNLESDKTEVFLYDLREDRILKKLFTNEEYDISGVSLSRHRNYELDYYSFEGEKEEIVPVSDYYKKLHAKITQRFPNKSYVITDKTDDEIKYLILIQSDKVYGEYYSYDPVNDKFHLVYNLMPQLKAEDMAQMLPISFMSRDGINLHGYITLPQAATEGKKVPVIVNPHGGPQGIRHSWGFNPETQLFASRGYATLQVNFRISGGYGKNFLESGFKQIGRKAIDDVEDGLQHVINKGWVDHEKAAIYGGSHGGYAVLRSLTKTPELYACGVDYVGVSNLFTFMQTIPPYWKPYAKILKEIWYDEEVPEEKLIMEEVSPVFHIEKIKRPLFVVQGANDPRVNIDESDQIVSSLRQKGVDVPYMVKYDEGHGFSKEENSIALYKAMLGFFAKHLKEEELQPKL